MTPGRDFVMSVENECLTSVLAEQGGGMAIDRLFDVMRSLAPTLPATSGIFNAYGRIYIDCGHVEMAAAECDSPYALVSVIESQQRLLAKAVEKLAGQGRRVVLANNNHSGLLEQRCPVWGAHENFLVEQHPSTFGELVLPFLATRIYQGAGGIEFPSGNFVAGVRPIAIELDAGGGTTEARAIHSTSRDEHHMGPQPSRFRYHLIVGDGHRSGYNLSLQAGATALALKAIFFDDKLTHAVRKLKFPSRETWVQRLKRYNRLASPRRKLAVDPLVIETQRVYLAAAHRYADQLGSSMPDWIPRLLQQWDQTLTELAAMNVPWLSQRLDAFIKYAFYSSILDRNGIRWRDLPKHPGMFNELALLDHRYHEFTNPKSWFNILDSKGLLQQRVCEAVEPGDEQQPYIPPVKTRARVRAEWIREHRGQPAVVVDWSWINDMAAGQAWQLTDPFAQEVALHQGQPVQERPFSLRRRSERMLTDGYAAYDRGEYTLAQRFVVHLQGGAGDLDQQQCRRMMRLYGWVQARLGICDADAIMESLYAGHTHDIQSVTDFCCTFRFRGLAPHAGIRPWLDLGFELLSGVSRIDREPAGTQALREHAAATLCAAGRHIDAHKLLETACTPTRVRRVAPRIRARLCAALGDLYRILGNRQEALRLLEEAQRIQLEGRLLGDLAEFTSAGLARLEDRAPALDRLATAKQTLRRLGHHMGAARIMLLEARIGGEAAAAENHERLVALRQQVPALGQCPRLAAILEHWPAWVSGHSIPNLSNSADPFYGI